MGKPFDNEIAALPHTYAWAMAQPIDALCRAVERLYPHPLLAVGSGGSFSVCHYAAHLHGLLTGQPAQPMTPLQAVDRRTPIAKTGILLPTAAGNNPDVVAAVRLLSEQEPEALFVLCGNLRSKVATQAARFRMVDFLALDLPTGKDGFLATNSLLAFCVLLSRAYLAVSGHSAKLPRDYRQLLSDRRLESNDSVAERRYAPLLGRETLLVLHGAATTAAAVDIESKFTEAALGHVQTCDFRQFAHGRHHWLAKRRDDTAILSLESPAEEIVAAQTLQLLPKSVPMSRVRLAHDSWIADLAGICEGFYLTAAAGSQRGIDPGRPGVPSFGRRLYHANAFRPRPSSSALPSWKARAIERKASERIDQLRNDDRLSFWTDAIDAVLDGLAETCFCGIVLDYDGTLCGEDQRFDPLPSDVASALSSLLQSGTSLGIATGRGKSVRERLREALPAHSWSQVTVGYYNGGQVIPLESNDLPDGADQVAVELVPVSQAIQQDRLLAKGSITYRHRQITLSPPRGLSLEALNEHVEALVHRVAGHGFRVMRSGHSVDVVPNAVSKTAVVARLLERSGNASAAVLRIGDRGRWPGNDAQLLASPFGLSVHEVSSDARSCWNLAPPGQRGWQATLYYLRHLRASKRGIRFRRPNPKRG